MRISLLLANMSDTSDGSKSEQSAPQQPPQKRWQFIDASNDSSANLTQVKRHVMQEYMRQKRRDAQHRDGAGNAQGEGHKSQQKKRQRQKRTRLRRLLAQSAARRTKILEEEENRRAKQSQHKTIRRHRMSTPRKEPAR